MSVVKCWEKCRGNREPQQSISALPVDTSVVPHTAGPAENTISLINEWYFSVKNQRVYYYLLSEIVRLTNKWRRNLFCTYLMLVEPLIRDVFYEPRGPINNDELEPHVGYISQVQTDCSCLFSLTDYSTHLLLISWFPALAIHALLSPNHAWPFILAFYSHLKSSLLMSPFSPFQLHFPFTLSPQPHTHSLFCTVLVGAVSHSASQAVVLECAVWKQRVVCTWDRINNLDPLHCCKLTVIAPK